MSLLILFNQALKTPSVATVARPQYYSASIDAVQTHRRQQLEEDEILLALIQQFVMET